MTEKLNTGWVNDRLPTEEDADKQDYVIWFKFSVDSFYECDFLKIKSGETWCRVPMDWGKRSVWPNNWRELIEKPKEYLDREKGKDEDLLTERPAHKKYLQEKIKELEQAFENSEGCYRLLWNEFEKKRIQNEALRKVLKEVL